MVSWLAGPKGRILTIPAFLIIFAAALFRLPYHFPVPPSVSVSYVFQYNNRIAVLIFLAGAAAFAMLFDGLSLKPASQDSRVRPAYAFAIAFLCVGVGALYWWISKPDGLEGESIYFFNRLAQLAAGKTIYKQFEFAYGPLLLYLPYWMSKLFHLSLIEGYIVFWLLLWAVGIWLLYQVVNNIDIPSPYRTAVFFIFSIDLAQPLWPEGINYTPTRALLSAALATLVYRFHRREYPPLAVAGIAILCAAVASAVSPEYGIAFMLGTTVFFLLCVKQPRYRLALGLMGAGFLIVVAICTYGGLYATLRAFASGGYNYPVLPIPGVLCVMGLFILAGCVAYRAVRRGQTDSLTLYLICICFFSLPSGFGRSDSGHMQLGALPALIIAALGLGRYPWIALASAVAFLYWPGTAQYHSDYASVRNQLEIRMFNPERRPPLLYRSAVLLMHLFHEDTHRRQIEAKVAQPVPFGGAPPVLPTSGIVDAPLGLTVRGYAVTDGRVDYGYFAGLQDVILPSQSRVITAWLDSHPEREIELPPGWQGICTTFGEAAEPGYQRLYGMHWASPKRQESVWMPLCNYIRMNYVPDDPTGVPQWTLWHRLRPKP